MTNLLGKNLEAQKTQEPDLSAERISHQSGRLPPTATQTQSHRHAHCHHKSVLKFDSESELLKRTGLDFQVLDSGCCGMAGSFGFGRRNMTCQSRSANVSCCPPYAAPPQDTLIITDGFSCYQQIEGLTGRKALHIAEVLQMAIRESRDAGKIPQDAPAYAEAHK